MNNIDMDRIESVVCEQINAAGLRLYDLVFNKVTKTLQVYIDHPVRNVTIEDCRRVSVAIGNGLDTEESGLGKYTLEVSSPGIQRALRRLEHFQWAIGKLVEMEIGGERIRGFIRNVNGEKILIATQDGETVIGYSSISKARIAEEIDYGKRR